MSYIRKSVVDTLTDEELLQMVKSGLDELGIPYEEKPGGFGPDLMLDPSIFEMEDLSDQFVLTEYTTKDTDYCPPQIGKCKSIAISSSMFGEYNIQFSVAA